MTNTIASLAIELTLATNWTGIAVGTNELGYVVTNHTAIVSYEGEVKRYTIKQTPAPFAVWREQKIVIFYNRYEIMTNCINVK